MFCTKIGEDFSLFLSCSLQNVVFLVM
jgi:hypothetical protein